MNTQPPLTYPHRAAFHSHVEEGGGERVPDTHCLRMCVIKAKTESGACTTNYTINCKQCVPGALSLPLPLRLGMRLSL